MFFIDKGDLKLTAEASALPVYKALKKEKSLDIHINPILVYTFYMFSKRGYYVNNPFKDMDYQVRKNAIQETFKQEFPKMKTFDKYYEDELIKKFIDFYKITQLSNLEIIKVGYEERLAGWQKELRISTYGDPKREKEMVDTINSFTELIDNMNKEIAKEGSEILLNEDCPHNLYELPESQKPNNLKIIKAL
jgi:hypothetical protein